MDRKRFPQPLSSRYLAAAVLILFALFVGCKSKSKADNPALDQAVDYFNGIQPLRDLKPSQFEIAQLAAAKDAGLNDQDCLALMDLARRRQQPFSDGDAIAGLLHAGMTEASVMSLARLNQLGPYAGEAQLMRLAGLSDEVILALARRRNSGQPALSSSKAAELRNVQLSNAQIIEAVNDGTTDAQADAIIARRAQAGGGHSFVRQSGRRR